ncbi:hypothetical protein HY933_01325 [Candidatus Falkowbacteria bacterium]|nr:hypothetical protein [Candidatus Falkowbacteria bacterium]
MGYKTEFNWVLVLTPEQGLPERLMVGTVYPFHKAEERIYPRGWKIGLAGKDWKIIAWVTVVEFTVKENRTEGLFEVVEVV